MAGENNLSDWSDCCPLLLVEPFPLTYVLLGRVVKVSASTVADLRFRSRLCQDFPGASHTSDLKTGTPVPTLPGAWRYRVSAGTGWPCVIILYDTGLIL